jgi:hypothetical protein
MAPLIRINDDVVAEKPQSTGNSHRGLFDIALPEFISYRDSPPFFLTGPGRWSGQDYGVAQWPNNDLESRSFLCCWSV